ncbi:3-ketoacyl-CoA thiolase 1, peroxisomal-like [Aristolochia californica]|uniref:3-ketoacyl-CoA thiolase 1, peroxisomal-like n=1 Tax=Aristolochia californica TaxID=171875 RepID=UPI0035D70142
MRQDLNVLVHGGNIDAARGVFNELPAIDLISIEIICGRGVVFGKDCLNTIYFEKLLVDGENLNDEGCKCYARFLETVPIRTMKQQGSSSPQVVTTVAAAIQTGFDDIRLGARLDSMTTNPMTWEGSIHPKLNNFQKAPDFLSLGITAEYVPHRIGVTRQDEDPSVFLSHNQAATTITSVAIKIIDTKKQKDKTVGLSMDDGCFHNAFVSDQATQMMVVKKDGTITVGNSSQVGDGAGAILFMRSSFAEQKALPFLGIFSNFIAVGVDRAVMGIDQPVVFSATVKALFEEVVPAFHVMVLYRIGVCYNK